MSKQYKRLSGIKCKIMEIRPQVYPAGDLTTLVIIVARLTNIFPRIKCNYLSSQIYV